MFKKPLDSDEIARNVHDWLRSKGVLDADHDLPYGATPTHYQDELERAVTGKFRKEQEPNNVVEFKPGGSS